MVTTPQEKGCRYWQQIKETEQEMAATETQSQTIKSILELCEAFDMPENAVSIVRKKCWYLADSIPQEQEQPHGLDSYTN